MGRGTDVVCGVIVGLMAGFLMCLPGCGDDDVTGPELQRTRPHLIRVPQDTDDLEFAAAAAAAGDTVLLAPGTYSDPDVLRVVPGVTIAGANDPAGKPVLAGVRFKVVADGGRTRLENLRIEIDRSPGVNADLNGAAYLDIVDCEFVPGADAWYTGLHGILCQGYGGFLEVSASTFSELDAPGDKPGAALRSTGHLTNCNIFNNTFTGVATEFESAVWVSDCDLLRLGGCTFTGYPSTADGVVHAVRTDVQAHGNRFEGCAGPVINLIDGTLELYLAVFTACGPGQVRIEGASEVNHIHHCVFTDNTAPCVVLDDHTEVLLQYSLFVNNSAAAYDAVLLDMDAWCDVRWEYCTFVANDCALAPMIWRSGLQIRWTIATDNRVPLVWPAQEADFWLSIIDCDFYDGAGTAWTGLEAHASANLAIDPLYCDPEARDYRLQTGSPAGNIGSEGVGCD